MKRTSRLAALFCLLFPAAAWAKLRVAATTTDLEWLTEAVGGESVEVESLSTGDQDIHFVEPRPSMVMRLKRADVLVRTGLDLDMWADSLVAAARNGKVVYGAPGYVDASVGIELLQIPVGKVDAAMGDIHVFGNPHYWLDPANAAVITKNILDGLVRGDPKNEAAFTENRERFLAALDAKLKEWDLKAAGLKGLKLVTYHNSWVYFAKRFGVELFGNIEPKPGIPPSPSHLERLISMMKEDGVRVIMAETYYPVKGSKMVAEKTGAELVIVPSSVGGLPGIKGYFDVFDCVLNHLVDAVGVKGDAR
ncbi:MAG: zinc ABC transporter substrate-binding protein [Elusimicrobia bacterium]|nr:zinc ABC transporter substrate-binding protein [Elusimicrobiota bacterium]